MVEPIRRLRSWFLPGMLILLAASATSLLVWPTPPARQPVGPPSRPEFPAALPASSPPTKSPWHDEAWLTAHLEKACDAVEWVCHAKFRKRPRLRGTTADEIERVLRQRVARRKKDGLGPRGWSWPDDDEYATHAKSAIGLFVPELNAICISRKVTEASVWRDRDKVLLKPDVLRVVLVHEVTHALDIERHPHLYEPRWFSWIGQGPRSAVLEGHAQHVCRLVAERWNISFAFEAIRGMYAGKPDEDGDDAETKESYGGWSYTMYVDGQKFIDTLHAHAGRFAVEEALAHPPNSMTMIRDPERWIAGWRLETAKPPSPAPAR